MPSCLNLKSCTTILLVFGFLSGCISVGPRVTVFSNASGVLGDGWDYTRQPNAEEKETLRHVYYLPTQTSFFFRAYNHIPNEWSAPADDFYLAVSLNLPSDSSNAWTLRQSSVYLQFQGREWPSETLRCTFESEPQKNSPYEQDTLVRVPYIRERDCVMFRFKVTAPRPSERFSVIFRGFRVNNRDVPPVEVLFDEGRLVRQGGFY